KIIYRAELDDDPTLAAAELDLDPGVERVGQPLGDVLQTWRLHGFPGRWLRLGGGGVLGEGDRLLGGPHGETLGHDPRGEVLLSAGIVEGEQGASVAGREHTGGDPALHRERELEQPDGIAD